MGFCSFEGINGVYRLGIKVLLGSDAGLKAPHAANMEPHSLHLSRLSMQARIPCQLRGREGLRQFEVALG